MTLDLHANFEDVVCPDCYTPHIWIINLNQQEIHWNLPRKLTLLKFNQLKTDIHTKLQKSRRKLYWARAKMFPRQRFLYMIQWCAGSQFILAYEKHLLNICKMTINHTKNKGNNYSKLFHQSCAITYNFVVIYIYCVWRKFYVTHNCMLLCIFSQFHIQ